MRWIWHVQTDAPHTVVAEVGFFGDEAIWVDGRLVHEVTSWKFQSDYRVPLGPRDSAKLAVRLAWYGMPRAELVVNGSAVPAGRPSPADLVGLERRPATPVWIWGFAVACLAIPLVSLGGAIPAAIGAVGATGCVAVGRRRDYSTEFKTSVCVAITAGSWLAFGLLIAALR